MRKLIISWVQVSVVLFIAVARVWAWQDSVKSREIVPMQFGFRSFYDMDQRCHELVAADTSEDYSNVEDMLFRDKQLQGIRDRGNESLWIWLSREGGYPFVSLVGFLCMKEKAGARGFEAALEVASCVRADSRDIVWPVWVYLRDVKGSRDAFEVFTNAMVEKWVEPSNVGMIVNALPEGFLQGWFRDVKREEFLGVNEYSQACIVSRLIEEDSEKKFKESVKFREVMEDFRRSNGVRLAVYVTESEVRTAVGFKEALIRLLRDASVREIDLSTAVYRHRAYVTKELKYHELELPERTLAVIDAIVSAESNKEDAE